MIHDPFLDPPRSRRGCIPSSPVAGLAFGLAAELAVGLLILACFRWGPINVLPWLVDAAVAAVLAARALRRRAARREAARRAAQAHWRHLAHDQHRGMVFVADVDRGRLRGPAAS